MLEISEIKRLMTARSCVTAALGEVFINPPKFETLYTLCKKVWKVTEIIEILDENDELLQGYNNLQDWYIKASQLDKHFVEQKLTEEFNNLFDKDKNGMPLDFPTDRSLSENYIKWDYKPKNELSVSNIAQMLFFISFVAEQTAQMEDKKDIGRSASFQVTFIDNFIMPYLSNFCGVLHDKSVSYGVYQYIAVILHGYLNLDSATMEFF